MTIDEQIRQAKREVYRTYDGPRPAYLAAERRLAELQAQRAQTGGRG